ncbi:MAG: ATP synthase F1 subunit epsilon [Planctomycetota bacterium]
MPDTLTCTLVTPETTLFDGDVSYVAIPAHDGSMGVAPGRAPLLAELGYGELRITAADGAEQRFFVGGGFVQVKAGAVTVLADEASEPGALDREAASKVLAEEATAAVAGDAAIATRERKARRARAVLAMSS